VVRVALTGGIATGKTHVRRAFAAAGVPTLDADQIARDVVAAGTAAAEDIVRRFGASVRDADGSINRRALAGIVFEDPAARRDLEAIIHPAVYDAVEQWFRSLPAGTPMAAVEIPLLYESGHQGDFDRVVVAACPPEEQVRRAIARDRLSEAEARARLAAQWPIEEKARRADYVITTTGTEDDTVRQVRDVIASIASGHRGR
jgi:dephospho-CoA kinase